MTLKQFEYLSEQDQELVLQAKAVHVASVADKKAIYTLFQVDGFYLEIQTNNTGHRFTTASFFDETELLEPYLEMIDIGIVYKLLGNRNTH